MTDDEKYCQILSEIQHIKGNLWGEDGREGDIQFIKRNIIDLRTDHEKLKTRVWFVIGLLTAAGFGFELHSIL